MKYKIIKLEIVKQNPKVKWECPLCCKINVEYNYDETKDKLVGCHRCGAIFKGKLDTEYKIREGSKWK